MQKQINNLKGIEIKYLGATNSRGSRVKLTDNLLGTSKTICYNYKYNNIVDIAAEYLENKGINVTGMCETKNGYMLLTDSFAISIK